MCEMEGPLTFGTCTRRFVAGFLDQVKGIWFGILRQKGMNHPASCHNLELTNA